VHLISLIRDGDEWRAVANTDRTDRTSASVTSGIYLELLSY
jgi:hypothetical protein